MDEMRDCPNVERNKQRCTCDYEPCERTGICCECIAYHRSKDQLPHCVRHLGAAN